VSARRAFTLGDYATLCPGGTPLASEAARLGDACAQASAQGLKHAMIVGFGVVRMAAFHYARLSRHHPGAGRAVWMARQHARIMGRGDEVSRKASVRLDPRSSFAFSFLAFMNAMDGNHEAALDAERRAVELNPYDMGARGVLGICHLVIGEHRQAIELFSMAAQRGNSVSPAINGLRSTPSAITCSDIMTPRWSWRARRCISIPIISRCSRCAPRRWRSRDATKRRPRRRKSCSPAIQA